MMKILWLVRLFVAATVADFQGSFAIPRDPLDRPNFVVFFVDDLGYADCGFTGHPTTSTPNIDKLAYHGKILTTWYSACPVCSCSRASLMTGRQYPRTGVKPVFWVNEDGGLPLEEITVAEQLKKRNYKTAAIGKWHLGQRPVYLPGNHGFDYYLGIPYSDDMGNGRYRNCDGSERVSSPGECIPKPTIDYATWYTPLVYQKHNQTTIVEQPVDFTSLASKYNDMATSFVEKHKHEPFFLYIPFSHVHTTTGCDATDWHSRPNWHYAQCDIQNVTRRGAFGDALAEVDWIVGNVISKLKEHEGLLENTLILFTSDNGPWSSQGLDGGSYGIFSGQFAGYHETGKGSTWEGGIREPAFAYWKGTIPPYSRSSETISSMDVFPTLSRLAGVDLPLDVVLDGRDMTDILLNDTGRSKHDFLFFYGLCNSTWPRNRVSAVRHGPYKAHFCAGPGLRGNATHGQLPKPTIYDKFPLLFNVEHDPSERFPLNEANKLPLDPTDAAAIQRIQRAYATEVATFEYGDMHPLPPAPGEDPNAYGLCCDRALNCSCSPNSQRPLSLFHRMKSSSHHHRYHAVLGEVNHADEPAMK